MTIEEVFRYYGNISQCSEAIGVTREAFYYWMRKGVIPFKYQLKYEEATNGKLKGSNIVESIRHISEVKIPKFKYISVLDGKCDVHSLSSLNTPTPRITYYKGGKRKYAFDIENLIVEFEK